jgi:hypothetical protein
MIFFLVRNGKPNESFFILWKHMSPELHLFRRVGAVLRKDRGPLEFLMVNFKRVNMI